ncbi:MAG TPA: M23 family metallopeptidase [Stellaceae bacterium]|nr:M23 family metallopeptidase [Stellaceae bacterium]
MQNFDRLRRRGWGAAVALAGLALTLAGCMTGGHAPVVNGEQGPPPPTQIIVERGQTLSGIAHAYHVPMTALAEANGLGPPYRILVGQALLIPAAAAGSPSGPMVAMVEPTAPGYARPAAAPFASPSVSAQPLPPPGPASSAPIPLDRPPPAATHASPVAEPPIALTPPRSEDALANPRTRSLRSGSETAAHGEVATTSPSGLRLSEHTPASAETPRQMASAEAPPPPTHGGGTFLWPVRGHVLEGFGAGPDGTHNDGINIAAPRGAAIEATDGGVVAYSGNELRGYGNLILIKHPGGWISAYAHCDLVLVKTGQKVARGQVIARVGSTGNVSEPQLHFELRRGKKPVDPREYLVPLSTAAASGAHPS